ncbi:MAG: ABC transporter ATP-binding protein, partial [Lentisphaerae bacterium]|nr:ABC transporter ATP-binding protein [Lentisphaerota bacterium]
TPVKRYSSGMYVRLAFAVAAHLEPEILLVDEVLAVGDSGFQKKCLGKMNDIAGEGRTVLFVSHNLAVLTNLCPRAMLLVEGKKHSDGPANEIAGEYMSMGKEGEGEVVWTTPATAPGNDRVRLHAVRVVSDGKVTSDAEIQNDIRIEIEFWNFVPEARVSTSIHLLDKLGLGVLASGNGSNLMNLAHDEWAGEPYPVGLFRTSCVLPGNFLNNGRYSINAIVLTDSTRIEAFAKEAISFNVYETGATRTDYLGDILGVVRPKLAWQTTRLEETLFNGNQG